MDTLKGDGIEIGTGKNAKVLFFPNGADFISLEEFDRSKEWCLLKQGDNKFNFVLLSTINDNWHFIKNTNPITRVPFVQGDLICGKGLIAELGIKDTRDDCA